MSFKTMDDGQVLLYAVSVELQWLTIIYNAKKKKKKKTLILSKVLEWRGNDMYMNLGQE